MKHGIKLAIADKVKRKAIDCHRLHKSSLTDCEPQYVDYYKHCLKFFGCEITKNTYNQYLSFIVYDPESLDKTVESCADSYQIVENRWSSLTVSFNVFVLLLIIFVAFVFGVLVGHFDYFK